MLYIQNGIYYIKHIDSTGGAGQLASQQSVGIHVDTNLLRYLQMDIKKKDKSELKFSDRNSDLSYDSPCSVRKSNVMKFRKGVSFSKLLFLTYHTAQDYINIFCRAIFCDQFCDQKTIGKNHRERTLPPQSDGTVTPFSI